MFTGNENIHFNDRNPVAGGGCRPAGAAETPRGGGRIKFREEHDSMAANPDEEDGTDDSALRQDKGGSQPDTSSNIAAATVDSHAGSGWSRIRQRMQSPSAVRCAVSALLTWFVLLTKLPVSRATNLLRDAKDEAVRRLAAARYHLVSPNEAKIGVIYRNGLGLMLPVTIVAVLLGASLPAAPANAQSVWFGNPTLNGTTMNRFSKDGNNRHVQANENVGTGAEIAFFICVSDLNSGNLVGSVSLGGEAVKDVDWFFHSQDRDKFSSSEGGLTTEWDFNFVAGGDRCASFRVFILDDSIWEGSEELIFQFTNRTQHISSDNPDMTLVINDNDSRPSRYADIEFHEYDSIPTVLSENLTSAERRGDFDSEKAILIRLGDLPSNGNRVFFQVRFSGSAVLGVDYDVAPYRGNTVLNILDSFDPNSPQSPSYIDSSRRNVLKWSAVTPRPGDDNVHLDLELRLKVRDDSEMESVEDIEIALDGGILEQIGPRTLQIRLFDNDLPAAASFLARISSSPETMTETLTATEEAGLFASANAVTMSYDELPVDVDVEVRFSGTAVRGKDYVVDGAEHLFSGSDDDTAMFRFAKNSTRTTIQLRAIDDNIDEPGMEFIIIQLTIRSQALDPQHAAVIQLTDNDVSPTVTISDHGDVTEGNTGVQQIRFDVTLAWPSAISPDVRIRFYTGSAGGSTVTLTGSEADIQLPEGAPADFADGGLWSITFDSEDQVTKSIVVSVVGDTLVEPDETLVLVIASESFGSGTGLSPTRAEGDHRGEAVILSDDFDVEVRVDEAEIRESCAGGSLFCPVRSFNFTFAFSSTPSVVVEAAIDWNFGGTATIGTQAADVRLDLDTLDATISNTSLTHTIPVEIVGDRDEEENETLTLTVTDVNANAGVNVTVSSTLNVATGTILNDDHHLDIVVGRVDEPENAASAPVEFAAAFTLSSPSNGDISFDFNLNTSSAALGADFRLVTGDPAAGTGRLTINPGETRVDVEFMILGDDLLEGTESITLWFAGGESLPRGSTLGKDALSRNIDILDEDAPRISALGPAEGVLEGDSQGQGGTIVFTIAMSPVPSNVMLPDDINVGFYFESRGAHPAEEGIDYTGGTGTVLFERANAHDASRREVEISVVISGDTVIEHDETVTFTIRLVSGVARIDTVRATAIIRNDDFPDVAIRDTRVAEGPDGETVPMTFELELDRPGVEDVNLIFSISGGTATVGEDYVNIGGAPPEMTVIGEVSVPAGLLIARISITVNGDDIVEPAEDVEITIAADSDQIARPIRATIGRATASGVILRDDVLEISVVQTGTVNEGDLGDPNPDMTFTVSLGPRNEVGNLPYPLDGDVTVSLTTADGTGGQAATLDNSDYEAGTATVSFAPGDESDKTFIVKIIPDENVEHDEILNVLVASTSIYANITAESVSGTILNDDLPIAVIANAEVEEGGIGDSTLLEFTVTLDQVGIADVSMVYIITGGTATGGPAEDDGRDYTALPSAPESRTLVIGQGDREGTISIVVVGDEAVEDDETIEITISNPVNATIDPERGIGIGTIIRDDVPRVSIAAASVAEGAAEDGGILEFTVSIGPKDDQGNLPYLLEDDVAVSFATGDGTGANAATLEDGDYLERIGAVTFSPDATADITVEIEVVGDGKVERDETFFVTLTIDSEYASVFSGTAIGTIANDDLPVFSISSPLTEEEEDGESSTLAFEISLDQPGLDTATIEYEYTGGSATATLDYEPFAGGSFTFLPGEILKTVFVTVYDDSIVESDESVEITIFDPNPDPDPGTSRLGKTVGVGIILDSDSTLLSIVAVPGQERLEEGGETRPDRTLAFMLTAFPLPQEPISVTLVLGGSTTEGADYRRPTTTQFIFTSVQLSHLFEVEIIDDRDPESDETLVVTMTEQSDFARIRIDDDGNSLGEAVGFILDNDSSFLSISSPLVVEGGENETTALDYRVQLNQPWTEEISVVYAVSGGTATAGEDYQAPPNAETDRTVLFPLRPSGRTVTEARIRIVVFGDTAAEPDETVELTLSSPTGGVRIRVGTGIGTIRSDDVPEVSISSPAVEEGNAGDTATLAFQVSLSGPWRDRVSVGFAITGGTATSGADYLPLLPSNVIFQPNELVGQIEVSVAGDDFTEADETVEITLSDAVNATLGVTLGVGVIRSDDSPALSINSPVVYEGVNEFIEFTVRLDPASTSEVSVSYRSVGGSATEEDDYEAFEESTLTFATGERVKTIQVGLVDDNFVEADETLRVELANPTGGAEVAVGRAIGIASIRRDPLRPIVSVISQTQKEGSAGEETPVRFNVVLSGQLNYRVSVDYEIMVVELDRRQGRDVRSIRGSGTVVFVAGVTGTTAPPPTVDPIVLMGNDSPGDERQLYIMLSNPQAESGEKSPDIRQEVGRDGIQGPGVEGRGGVAASVIIEEDDAFNRDIGLSYALAGAGSTFASDIVSMVWDRAESHRTRGGKFLAMAGGRAVDGLAQTGGAPGPTVREVGKLLGLSVVDPDKAPLAEHVKEVQGSGFGDYSDWANLPDKHRLINGSRFVLPIIGDPGVNSPAEYVLWGRGLVSSHTSGLEDEDLGEFVSEGNLSTGTIGIDYRRREDVLFGIAFSVGSGDLDYSFEDLEYTQTVAEYSLSGFTPYIHLISVSDFSFWAAASVSNGQIEIEDIAEAFESDISMEMAAFGVRGGEADATAFGLAGKLDGYIASIEVDEVDGGSTLAQSKASVSRIRAAIQAISRTEAEGGSAASARFELGGRYDGGDVEGGTGADVAFKVNFSNPYSGIELTAKGDAIVFHAQENLKQWSAGFGAAYNPNAKSNNRRFRFSLGPTWNTPVSNVSAMGQGGYSGLSGSDGRNSGPRLEARMSYDVGVLQGRAVATVYSKAAGAGMLQEDRSMRVGAELQGPEFGLGRVRLEIYGEVEEARSETAEKRMNLQGTLGF